MNAKKFLKPDLHKIALFLLALALSSLVGHAIVEVDSSSPGGSFMIASYGLPLQWRESNCELASLPVKSMQSVHEICSLQGSGYLQFVADAIFWYLIACAAVFASGKIRKKIKAI